jgi:hypothetical protein
MASNHTISTVPRISSHELSQIILAANTSSNLDNVVPPKHLAVVDVRDDGLSPIPNFLFWFLARPRSAF